MTRASPSGRIIPAAGAQTKRGEGQSGGGGGSSSRPVEFTASRSDSEFKAERRLSDLGVWGGAPRCTRISSGMRSELADEPLAPHHIASTLLLRPRRAGDNLRKIHLADDRRTPVPLDVLDHQFRAPRVADVRRL